MDATQLITTMLEDLQRGFRREVEPLTQEQFVARPTPEANTVAFVLWHVTRTEDNIVHGQVTSGTPLWVAEGWHDRLGLEPDEGGTGFTAEQVGAFQPRKEDLIAYCERVWEVAPGLLSTLTEEDLDRAPNPDRPHMTLGRSLANFMLGHGFWHLGDIRFIKGLQGMPFSI